MILVKIESKQLKEPIAMPIPTGKIQIQDAYTLLGTKKSKQYRICIMDYDYEYCGEDELEQWEICELLDWFTSGRASLEGLNCFALLWEKMTIQHIDVLAQYSKRRGNILGMKELINLTYRIGNLKLNLSTKCTVRKKYIYDGKHLPVEPEDYVFQIQCRNSKLNLPADEVELENFLMQCQHREITQYRTVIPYLFEADMYDLWCNEPAGELLQSIA